MMPDETTTRGDQSQILVRLDQITRRLTAIERRLTALERWRMEVTAASLGEEPHDD